MAGILDDAPGAYPDLRMIIVGPGFAQAQFLEDLPYNVPKSLRICFEGQGLFVAVLATRLRRPAQQRPAPAKGGIFKRHWWRFWQPPGAYLPAQQYKRPIIRSWTSAAGNSNFGTAVIADHCYFASKPRKELRDYFRTEFVVNS